MSYAYIHTYIHIRLCASARREPGAGRFNGGVTEIFCTQASATPQRRTAWGGALALAGTTLGATRPAQDQGRRAVAGIRLRV